MAPSNKEKGNAGSKKVEDQVTEAKQEEDLKASLKRLHDAYKQLSDIRLAMHKILQPLHATASEPELVYSSFAETAQKTMKNIKDFRASMQDKKMQGVLSRGKEWSGTAEGGNGWLGALNPALDTWHLEEEAGAAANRLDALKIERQATPKKS